MPETLTELPSVLWLPSDRAWLDPPLVTRQLYTQYTTRQLVGDVVVPLATLNPLRWAVGFALATQVTATAAPFSDQVAVAGWTLTIGEPVWFYLPRHGPLVTGEWYGVATGAETWRLVVMEVVRNV